MSWITLKLNKTRLELAGMYTSVPCHSLPNNLEHFLYEIFRVSLIYCENIIEPWWTKHIKIKMTQRKRQRIVRVLKRKDNFIERCQMRIIVAMFDGKGQLRSSTLNIAGERNLLLERYVDVVIPFLTKSVYYWMYQTWSADSTPPLLHPFPL